jgi:Sec-independent protein translocase protein TatA
MGKGIREFRSSISGDNKKEEEEIQELERSRAETAVRDEEAPLVEGEVVHDRRP